MLSKDEILRCRDIPTKEVYIKEWGGSVLVRAMTAGERDNFEIEMKEARLDGRTANVRGTLAVRVLIDGDGKRLFEDHDAATLAAMHVKPLDRIWDVAAKLSGITAEDVQELEKNSGNGQPGSSSSSSRCISAEPSKS